MDTQFASTAVAVGVPAAVSSGECEHDEMLARVGQITRTLHDSLRELGFDIPLGERISLDLGARYERGLVTIYDEEDVITDIKTRALFFGVGLSYLL